LSRYIDLNQYVSILADQLGYIEEHDKEMENEIRVITGKQFVKKGNTWIPFDDFLEEEMKHARPLWDENFRPYGDVSHLTHFERVELASYRDEIKKLVEDVDYLKNQNHKLEKQLKQAANTNTALYLENERYKRDIDMLVERGIISLTKNGDINFPEIDDVLGQHKDKTPEDMVETFRGIYEVWENHPELNLSELMCKVFSKKSATMTDEEFVNILKEAYNA